MTYEFFERLRNAFHARAVEVTTKTGTLWTGVVENLDEHGIWLKDPKQTHFVAWDSIEGISEPPEEGKSS